MNMEHNHSTENHHTDHNHHDHQSMQNAPHGHAGHDHHAMMIQDFKRRFWISLVLSLPVIVLSPMIQGFFGFHFEFSGSIYLSFVLSAFIYTWGGLPFLKGLKEELGNKVPGMMTLIAVAITVAFVYSGAVVVGLPGKIFFWELVSLIDIMLLGHWIEMKSVLGASKALQLLVSMMPAEAHKVHGNHIMEVNVEELVKDDRILIKPGEKVPADGIVTEGESFINESMLTGESTPVRKTKNDNVIGGSINGNGSLTVAVTHSVKEGYLNKVITLVREAQQSKSKTQHLADRSAKWLTYISLGAGMITFAIWLSLGYDLAFALERMVTVMVISCPHALGLAIPLVVSISTSHSAQNGLLIRNRTAFENSRNISVVVFDKTGTLTKGSFGVTRYESVADGFSKEDIIRLSSALERRSEHPIAVGIVAKAKELNVAVPPVENFNALSGKGVEAVVENKSVKVVSPGYLKENSITIPEQALSTNAETVVFVVVDNRVTGYIALADEIRPESSKAIARLKKSGIKVMMATGDNKTVAEAVSRQLGLDGYFAEVLPHQKVQIVKDLQAQHEFVAMSGDGVNDAPALAQANVGIAIGSGTDIAAETADIILVNSNPRDIAALILFGKATYKKMIQNLIWATAYNSFAIPLAAGVLFTAGFMLSPAVGAVFMSLSTVIVALNAQLLKSKMKNLIQS